MNHTPCHSLLRNGVVTGYVRQRGIKVDVSLNTACEPCAAGRGCGMGLIARRQHQSIILMPDCSPEQYQQRYPLGARVTFRLAATQLTAITVLIYALPLMMALTMTGLAVWAGGAEWHSVIMFFGGLLSGVLALKYLLNRRVERFRPRLVS